jgi:hypothetical protein
MGFFQKLFDEERRQQGAQSVRGRGRPYFPKVKSTKPTLERMRLNVRYPHLVWVNPNPLTLAHKSK